MNNKCSEIKIILKAWLFSLEEDIPSLPSEPLLSDYIYFELRFDAWEIGAQIWSKVASTLNFAVTPPEASSVSFLHSSHAVSLLLTRAASLRAGPGTRTGPAAASPPPPLCTDFWCRCEQDPALLNNKTVAVNPFSGQSGTYSPNNRNHTLHQKRWSLRASFFLP